MLTELKQESHFIMLTTGTGTSTKTHLDVSQASSHLWAIGGELDWFIHLFNRKERLGLLFSWKTREWIVSFRGSVLKLIYHNFIIFVVLYFLISFIYRFVLLDTDWQREVFELLCIYAARFQSYIPLNFLIGFYVQQVGKFGCLGTTQWVVSLLSSWTFQVVSRWWNTFTALPFPDKIALKLVRSEKKKSRSSGVQLIL